MLSKFQPFFQPKISFDQSRGALDVIMGLVLLVNGLVVIWEQQVMGDRRWADNVLKTTEKRGRRGKNGQLLVNIQTWFESFGWDVMFEVKF